MTRLAILADIHGNLPALELVAADLARRDVDTVVVAGDAINWGPFSPQVTAFLRARGWPVVRGNNELYLLDHGTARAPASWAEFTLPPWLLDQMGPDLTRVVAGWPDALQLRFRDAPPVYVCHGVPGDPFTAIMPNTPDETIAARLDGRAETTIIAGHSHLPLDRHVNGWHILNPGSVGVPLAGRLEATYMLADTTPDGWRATLVRLPLDMTPVLAAFARADFVARCGPIGRLVIEEFRTARLQVHPYLRWKEAHHPDAETSHALVDAFLTCDPTPYLPAAYLEILGENQPDGRDRAQ